MRLDDKKDQPSSWLICDGDHRTFDNLMKVQVFALFSEAEIKSGYDSHHEEVVGKRYVS
ncbi:hypothetical protein OH690_22490 [Escherichia coli]|nr:hypothetical protein [Escherichia coli]